MCYFFTAIVLHLFYDRKVMHCAATFARVLLHIMLWIAKLAGMGVWFLYLR